MEKQKFAATGRRKESTARATLTPGSGKGTVNGKKLEDYLTRDTLINHALRPLEVTENLGKFDVVCSASGGGISGQAGAIRLAIARALKIMDPELRAILRAGGFLTRDPREVERKKYGQPKARKKFQYSKR
ncbi:MAG TPA: 30S ribosomal protein S9 [candidate division Zixibacteria bacterium]|nr:30S ribosomal protein S9 [candidate division Zixibacteria bacterium]